MNEVFIFIFGLIIAMLAIGPMVFVYINEKINKND
jgi:hypothetical protein